jgi:DMSO/TMAO reductase YedYZ heme-binding membrane subunit
MACSSSQPLRCAAVDVEGGPDILGALRRDRFGGLGLVAGAAAIAVAMSAAFLAHAGITDDGLRTAIRATARESLVLFLLTFVASSVNALLRNDGGKWVLRNRKFLGNAFAASHATHGALIVVLAALDTEHFLARTSATGLYGGLFGYVVLAAMVITSFEVPTRRLGRRRWRILHKTGMYVFFAIFLFTYLPTALAGSPVGIAATLALLGAVTLRVIARLRRADSR